MLSSVPKISAISSVFINCVLIKKQVHSDNNASEKIRVTDGRTDRPSYRDAWTNLKMCTSKLVARSWAPFEAYRLSASVIRFGCPFRLSASVVRFHLTFAAASFPPFCDRRSPAPSIASNSSNPGVPMFVLYFTHINRHRLIRCSVGCVCRDFALITL